MLTTKHTAITNTPTPPNTRTHYENENAIVSARKPLTIDLTNPSPACHQSNMSNMRLDCQQITKFAKKSPFWFLPTLNHDSRDRNDVELHTLIPVVSQTRAPKRTLPTVSYHSPQP